MTVEKLIQRIQQDAQKETQQMKKEAEKKAKAIVAEAKQEAQHQVKEILSQGEQQADTLKKILLSQASQEIKRGLMTAREELIEACFTQTQKQLAELQEERYHTVLTVLLRDGSQKIKGPSAVLICRESDKTFIEQQGFTVSGMVEGTGGVVLQSKDGKITVDNTFEGILKRKKNDIRIHVGKLLFSTNG